ncbi:hypothetical protein PEBR_08338 [Penicillium brasilianum]|uniref:Uncharacterized protein n=1 Tax=Penicillium brasilianum TaxID=104259 RepID=A0A1S9RX94_PENBI|nr:hypothetical protein PEBR_08338 [Penicillium brasilianum]
MNGMACTPSTYTGQAKPLVRISRSCLTLEPLWRAYHAQRSPTRALPSHGPIIRPLDDPGRHGGIRRRAGPYVMLGRFLSEIAESGIGGPPQYNEPLDMDLPILELLESTRRANKFLFSGWGSRDLWIRVIEESAPGYLELEGGGIQTG